MSGIVAQLPSAIAGTLELGRQGALSTGLILIVLVMAVAEQSGGDESLGAFRGLGRRAPLVAGMKYGAGAVLWVAVSPGQAGYEREAFAKL